MAPDRWYSRVDGLGFYDAVKCGSIDAVVGEDIPPHDRAVCRAQVAKYRPSEASFPERDFKLWSEEKVEEMGKARYKFRCVWATPVYYTFASVELTSLVGTFLAWFLSLFSWFLMAENALWSKELEDFMTAQRRGRLDYILVAGFFGGIRRASLFIGRLHPNVQHDQLHSALSRLLSVVKRAKREGKHRRKDRHHSHHHHHSRDRSPEQHKSRTKDSLWPLVRVVKHPITGGSLGYAFAWFKSSRDANRVLESWRRSSNFFKPSGCSEGVRVDLGSIFVDMLGFEQVGYFLYQ
ncbi:hypothetical protein ACTXT7_013223 [Hymenolepis weldensis]